MIDVKEIIEKHQKLIAKKYKLGNSLVTGHRKGYFDEASEEAIREIITEVLKEAADNAKAIDNTYSMGGWGMKGGSVSVSKESITSLEQEILKELL